MWYCSLFCSIASLVRWFDINGYHNFNNFFAKLAIADSTVKSNFKPTCLKLQAFPHSILEMQEILFIKFVTSLDMCATYCLRGSLAFAENGLAAVCKATFFSHV